jgi:hypothetical protein
MASREHEHDQPIVLDVANQSIGPDAITPKTMPCAAQCSPMAAWIVRTSDALAQIAQDLSLSRWVETT